MNPNDSKDASAQLGLIGSRQFNRASSAAQSLPGSQPAQPTSIRELYSEWCVSVRMHAQASALSAVPPALAQRASLSAKALTSSNAAATAFKGTKPLVKAVPAQEGLFEVTRDGESTFSDRLWLDQMNLTRCCVVKVLLEHFFAPPAYPTFTPAFKTVPTARLLANCSALSVTQKRITEADFDHKEKNRVFFPHLVHTAKICFA
jgi:hypothetical protein